MIFGSLRLWAILGAVLSIVGFASYVAWLANSRAEWKNRAVVAEQTVNTVDNAAKAVNQAKARVQADGGNPEQALEDNGWLRLVPLPGVVKSPGGLPVEALTPPAGHKAALVPVPAVNPKAKPRPRPTPERRSVRKVAKAPALAPPKRRTWHPANHYTKAPERRVNWAVWPGDPPDMAYERLK